MTTLETLNDTLSEVIKSGDDEKIAHAVEWSLNAAFDAGKSAQRRETTDAFRSLGFVMAVDRG